MSDDAQLPLQLPINVACAAIQPLPVLTQDIEAGRYPPKQTTTVGRVKEADDTKRDRKDERRKKAAGGKAGGGTQGRATKTKSTKKKYMRKAGQESDEEEDAGRGRTTGGEVRSRRGERRERGMKGGSVKLLLLLFHSCLLNCHFVY